MNAAQRSGCSAVKVFQSFLLLVCALFILTSCEGKKTIVYGLDQNEANEILVFLSNKRIEADKVRSTEGTGAGAKVVLWDIEVNASDANEAMRQLNQQGLPRRPGQSVLGIFSTGGLVSSDLQEKIKYRAALAAQLASTIRKYEGVLDADVQVSFPEEDPLNPGKTKGKITASIWVKHSGILDDPNRQLANKIKRYVASAITGLNLDDVSIISERSRVGDAPIVGPGGEEEKQLVSVWSLIIAKDSVTMFRVIFFSFSMIVLVLGLSLVWIIWKVHPLLSSHGGLKALMSIKPLTTTSEEENKAEEDEQETEKKLNPPKKEEKKGTSIEKDIDET